MVKKKGKSKRTTLKDKYKIQKRVKETHRKRNKQARKDEAAGKVYQKKKDPGIPNSWPFKQDLLKEIQRTRDRQQAIQEEKKAQRREGLLALREHQAQGGTARTVEELMAQANQDQQEFQARQDDVATNQQERSDGSTPAGQQSRRAYLRELKKTIDSADVILQVLDARDPMSSRVHPSIENAILSRADKRMVLVLNKIDLVPKEIISAWLTTLRRSHPTIAIKASQDRSSDSGASDDATAATASSTPVGMEGLLQLLKNYARTGGTGGKSKTTIVVGVIGFPNVGKSSIINALKRTRAVGVSPRPGFTKSMQEVVLDKNVRLLDSPGVVFDDKSALLGNCVDAESLQDPIPAISALLERCDHSSLIMTYNIPSFPKDDVMMFLAMVARAYGRVGKGGIPDKMAAARSVLKDWNTGKIPYYTAPPVMRAEPEKSADAQIMNEFGKEFDLSQYDNEVLGSLKTSDEMDFVQLKEATRTDEDADADILEASSSEEDDDEMEEDELANAEDYEFS